MMSKENPLQIAPFPKAPLWPFPGWCVFLPSTPAVPELYWNVVSQEQRWKTLCCDVKKVIEYAQQLGANINADHSDVERLEQEFDEFKKSGFFDYYEAQIRAWVNENLERIIREFVDVVFFGLTDDGRFCAFIPEAWSDIEFDTGTSGEKYGHLILRYNVAQTAWDVRGETEASVIDNTSPYYG